MPPRRINDDFIDGDSDSDVSILDDEPSTRKSKGKGKAVDGRKGDKGKSKAKEVCKAYMPVECSYPAVAATLCLGGVIYAFMGHSTRRRVRKPAHVRAGSHRAEQATKASHSCQRL